MIQSNSNSLVGWGAKSALHPHCSYNQHPSTMVHMETTCNARCGPPALCMLPSKCKDKHTTSEWMHSGKKQASPAHIQFSNHPNTWVHCLCLGIKATVRWFQAAVRELNSMLLSRFWNCLDCIYNYSSVSAKIFFIQATKIKPRNKETDSNRCHNLCFQILRSLKSHFPTEFIVSKC